MLFLYAVLVNTLLFKYSESQVGRWPFISSVRHVLDLRFIWWMCLFSWHFVLQFYCFLAGFVFYYYFFKWISVSSLEKRNKIPAKTISWWPYVNDLLKKGKNCLLMSLLFQTRFKAKQKKRKNWRMHKNISSFSTQLVLNFDEVISCLIIVVKFKLRFCWFVLLNNKMSKTNKVVV